MSNNLPSDHRGFDLKSIAHEIDVLFGFESRWEVSTTPGETTWELDGLIVIDLEDIDRLCTAVQSLGPDIGHVYRYVLAHEKTHHDQELHRTYSKSYLEDVRPYELDADLVAGWICAHSRIPNCFRFHGLATNFNDLNRVGLMQFAKTGNKDQTRQEYPWHEEREIALLKGGRQWAAGQINTYNTAAQKLGLPDESFQEFLADVPSIVRAMWDRPVPQKKS